MNVDLDCLSLAARQFGVLHVQQAEPCGLSRRALESRLKRGWRRLHPRVMAVAGDADCFEQRALAAQLYAGPDSLLRHCTAGRLHGLDGVPIRAIEISTSRRLRRPGLIVHQRSNQAMAAKHFGPLKTTTVEQTLLDVAGVLDEERLEMALDSALRQGLTLIRRVQGHVEDVGGPGVRGAAAISSLLAARSAEQRPPESVVETRFARLQRRFKLPPAKQQHDVALLDGAVTRVDFAYPHLKIAIEIDSVRWHSGLRSIHRDNARHNQLVALGWLVLHFEWEDVVRRPEWVAAQVGAAIETRWLRRRLSCEGDLSTNAHA